MRSAGPSRACRARCPTAPGPAGCSATTTSRASPPPPVPAASRPRSACSCCSPCAARPRSTTARRSAWSTSRWRPPTRGIRSSAASPAAGATRSARRCSGTRHRTPGSPPPASSRGCRSRRTPRPCNVAGQAEDPDSILTLTRRLIELRREHPILHAGDFEPFGPTPDGTFAFRRVSPLGQLTVALNLTGEDRSVPGAGPGRVLIGTHRDRDGTAVATDVDLRPNEAVVVEVAG